MQLNILSWNDPFRLKGIGQGGIPPWAWVLLGVCGSLLSWHWITNEDLGFQLHAAKYLLENGDVPRQEPFLWTEPSGTYINLQWLWQLSCYVIWNTGGAGWLMAFNLLLQLLAVGVLGVRRLQLGQGTLAAGAGTYLILLVFLFRTIGKFGRTASLGFISASSCWLWKYTSAAIGGVFFFCHSSSFFGSTAMLFSASGWPLS